MVSGHLPPDHTAKFGIVWGNFIPAHEILCMRHSCTETETVIPEMAFKFGANHFNFFRVGLGQVRFCYAILFVMLFVPRMSIIFVISTLNDPIINTIYATMRCRTTTLYLPILLNLHSALACTGNVFWPL